MQKAEKISGRMPRIAVFCVEGARDLIGGSTLDKKFMDKAVAQAEEQWRNGFEAKLQMCSETAPTRRSRACRRVGTRRRRRRRRDR